MSGRVGKRLLPGPSWPCDRPALLSRNTFCQREGGLVERTRHAHAHAHSAHAHTSARPHHVHAQPPTSTRTPTCTPTPHVHASVGREECGQPSSAACLRFFSAGKTREEAVLNVYFPALSKCNAWPLLRILLIRNTENKVRYFPPIPPHRDCPCQHLGASFSSPFLVHAGVCKCRI